MLEIVQMLLLTSFSLYSSLETVELEMPHLEPMVELEKPAEQPQVRELFSFVVKVSFFIVFESSVCC